MKIKYAISIALLAITLVVVGCSKSDEPPAAPAGTQPAADQPQKAGKAGAAQATLGPGAEGADARTGSAGK